MNRRERRETMNARDERDLNWAEVWGALAAAGAQVYEWHEEGVATGCRVIRLGDDHALSVSDSEGYQVDRWDDFEGGELVPSAKKSVTRYKDYNPDGKGARPHPVHDLPPVLIRQDTTDSPYAVPEYYDYWEAVTDVPCPACQTGTVRWAEAGYVAGYRICDGCGQHFMADGSASTPALIELRGRRTHTD